VNRSNAEVYNENMEKSLKNVQTAAELSGPLAITAVKITAFIAPDTLQKLNQVVEQHSSENRSILELASSTSLVRSI
jgi:hypothetical protein